MSNIKKSLCIVSILFVSTFFIADVANAELVAHKGLPNREGVKPDPLDARLTNPDLPYRDGIKTGPATFHASLKAEGQFDSNVWLEDSEEDFDYITVLTPTLGVDLPVGDNNFAFDYEMRNYIFSNFIDKSYIDHKIRAVAEINLTDYQLSLTDIYRNFEERAGSEDTNHVHRQNNFTRAGIAGQFDQLGFETGYTFGIEDFIADDIIFVSPTTTMNYHDKNRLMHVLDAKVSYLFQPKTSIIFEQYFGMIEYESTKSSDSFFVESMIGLAGKSTSKITANIYGGFRYQEYNESDVTSSNGYIGPVARGGLTYKATDKDTANLILERNIYESVFSQQNFYNINHIGLDWTHDFNRKISTRIFGYYQLNLYPSEATVGGVTDKRHDHLYGAGIAARYDIQDWMAYEIKYQYKVRDSIFDTFDFVDNLVTITAVVGF